MLSFMDLAIEQAKRAALRRGRRQDVRSAVAGGRAGDVPVGCVIVRNGKVISSARNKREQKQNAILHSEIIAISKACKKLHSWRLSECEMYVTLEPCLMCIGAILNARIKKVYIGTKATMSNLNLFNENNLNWKTQTEVLDCAECRNILIDFFASRR